MNDREFDGQLSFDEEERAVIEFFRDGFTRYMARLDELDRLDRGQAVTELLDAARRFLADLRVAQLALRACMARLELDELNRPDELNGAS